MTATSEAGAGAGGARAGTLAALARAFPYPAFAFDPDAGLHWSSPEGAARLAVVAERRAGAPAVGGAFLAAALCDPGPDGERRLSAALRAVGLWHTGERTLVRRIDDGGRRLTLVMMIPARAGLEASGALTAA